MNNFQIGDRVTCLLPSLKGENGTVVGICNVAGIPFSSTFIFNVCFDDYNTSLHNCDGKCADGHGWNIWADDLCYTDETDNNKVRADGLEEIL